MNPFALMGKGRPAGGLVLGSGIVYPEAQDRLLGPEPVLAADSPATYRTHEGKGSTSALPAGQSRFRGETRTRLLEFIGHLISSLLSGGTNFDMDSTPRQRVKHALRLSARRRPLSAEQTDFAHTWLKHGLANLVELKLQPKESRIRNALAAVSKASA